MQPAHRALADSGASGTAAGAGLERAAAASGHRRSHCFEARAAVATRFVGFGAGQQRSAMQWHAGVVLRTRENDAAAVAELCDE